MSLDYYDRWENTYKLQIPNETHIQEVDNAEMAAWQSSVQFVDTDYPYNI